MTRLLFEGIIVPASILVPITIAVIRYKQEAPAFRVMLFYLIIAGLVNAAAYIMAHRHIHNLPLLHVYTIVETLLLLWFYQLILQGRNVRMLIRAVMVLFSLLCMANMFFIQSIHNYNSYTRPVEAIIIIGCSIAWLVQAKPGSDNSSWGQNPANWMNAGLLLYFSCALVLFAFSNMIMYKGNKSIHSVVWNMHAGFVLIMYQLFAIGFYKCKK